MRFVLSVLFAPLLFGCASPTPCCCTTALANGYAQSEELREAVVAVTSLEAGVWEVQFERSARRYFILEHISPNAAELVARAQQAMRSRDEVCATILVHEAAPKTKSKEAHRAAESPRHPWIVVRFADRSVPASAERECFCGAQATP